MPFTDAFTGTNGDDLEGRTGWTRVDGAAGAAEVNASNQLKFSSTTETAYTAPATGTGDHYAQADFLDFSHSFFPVCIRVTDKDNFIGLRLFGASEKQIYKRVSGTFTLLYSSAGVPAGVYKLEGSGSSINLFRNGVDAGNPVATDSAHSSVTTPGLVCRSGTADPVIDDWESTSAAAGGTAVPVFAHHYNQMRMS